MASTRKLKKNSVQTTTTANITAADTTIPVTETSRFYDKDGVLITRGIVIGGDNANSILPEEITITGASATSGAGNLTGVTRGVNADGTIGAGYAWLSGTNIGVTFSTGIYESLLVLPNRNAIINGDCKINQRVTAYTLVKDAYCWDSSNLYGPDRFEGMATGTLVTAGTFGQTTSSSCGSSGYGFRFTNVTLTGTGIIYMRYRMEAKDSVEYKNKTTSFSSKVYHNVGSAVNYTVYIRKANAADNFAAVTAISNSGAISVPDATETTLKYESISMGDCSNGIEIEIKIECGAITTKTFDLTEIQFERGAVATSYEFRHIQQERALCQRYYQKSYNLSIAPATASQTAGLKCLVAQNTSAIPTPFLYPVPMRSSPTLLTYAYDGTSGAINEYGAGNVAGVTPVTGENGPLEVDKSISLTAGTYYQFHYTAAAEL